MGSEAENVKALFRRASASMALQGFAEACVDLRKLLEVDPSNTEAQKLLAQAIQSGKAQTKQTSAMFSKMTKALDGNIAEEQEKRREEERHHKKPGQVLSIAESEREMEKAMAMAQA